MWWPTPSPQPCDGLEPISATIIVDEQPADSILFVMFFLRTSHHQVAGNRKIWSGLSEVNTVVASYFFPLYELKVNFCKSLDSQMNGHNLDKMIPKSHILCLYLVLVLFLIENLLCRALTGREREPFLTHPVSHDIQKGNNDHQQPQQCFVLNQNKPVPAAVVDWPIKSRLASYLPDDDQCLIIHAIMHCKS